MISGKRLGVLFTFTFSYLQVEKNLEITDGH